MSNSRNRQRLLDEFEEIVASFQMKVSAAVSPSARAWRPFDQRVLAWSSKVANEFGEDTRRAIEAEIGESFALHRTPVGGIAGFQQRAGQARVTLKGKGFPPSSMKVGPTDLMLRAIALARKCKSEAGRTSPKVGAVVARNGIVIGEAFRGELRTGEHAEFTLLERKLRNDSVAGATLFTTLEPCTSRNDPKIPCADRIVERRIEKVFIGILDPNERICGRGEFRLRDAGIQIARFDSTLMPEIEEMNRDFLRQHRLGNKRHRTRAETNDPVAPGEVGPNGHRIGYTKSGDKVEWIPDDERPGKEWPLLLRRNDRLILKAYSEFWDKVWWNRHQVWLEKIRSGQEPLTKERSALLAKARRAAKKIEKKYGRRNLEWDDFEWGLLSGRMSALAWVMGSEWEESGDT